MLALDLSLTQQEFARFLQLAAEAREFGCTLKRDGSAEAPFYLVRHREVVYENASLDAIADWLKD